MQHPDPKLFLHHIKLSKLYHSTLRNEISTSSIFIRLETPLPSPEYWAQTLALL
jgi:hypothetical protein